MLIGQALLRGNENRARQNGLLTVSVGRMTDVHAVAPEPERHQLRQKGNTQHD